MAKQLSLEHVVTCGVEKNIAAAMLPQINLWLSSLPASECWQQLTRYIVKPSNHFALHQLLYETTFSEWDTNQDPPPAWFPSEEQIQATNIAALMNQLKVASYPELHAWSARHRAEFWDIMIQRLGIRFRQNYSQIVDLSQGVESPQWLVGSCLNITESCFQAPEDAIAIIFQQDEGLLSTLTYGELYALTNRVANGLMDAGFQAGDAIAIDMPMTAESIAIYLGIVKVGCVVVAIADSFAANEIATRLRLSKAKAIFTQDYIRRAGKQLPLYTKVVDADAPRAIVLALDSSVSIKLRHGDLSWNEFLSPNKQFDAVPAHPNAYTNILFSSGTTGEPKAIPWTQTTPIKCAVDGHLHHDIHPGDVVAWPTNLGWMMGPWLIYASLVNRATIALYYGTPTEREFGQFVQDARVNVLGVVPSLVSIWKTTTCMQGLDWSAIKAFSSTGECSNPQDMLFLMSLAGYKPIIEYCGGTEIGGGYITGTLVQPCAPSTFTTPALGMDVVILDEDGHPADKGEVFIIPPSIGLSTELLNKDHHQVYFADTPHLPISLLTKAPAPSLSSLKLRLSPTPLRRHGDQMERLHNGYYRAQGRVDDTMNLGGIKVSSAEIEQALNTVEEICETAAIAISPPEGGPSQLVIYAVVAPDTHKDKEAIEADLKKAIAQHLNPLFKIRDLVLVDALPRTASNKVMRRVLRDWYQFNAVKS
ncbi:AMP-binding protein [Microcoleus sp. ZQ-A2]|nr:AMP-binding protein [Microcoleus sp. FACHB-1]